MAGDLKQNEYLNILEAPSPAARAGAEPQAKPGFVHRYGRVAIGMGPSKGLPGPAQPAPSAAVMAALSRGDFDEVERMGLEAFQHRLSPQFVSAKQNRPRQGEKWNMMGCTLAGTPRGPGMASRAPE